MPVKKTAKSPKRPKKITYSQARNKAWDALSRFVRYRDCIKTTGTITHGKCYTCGADKIFSLLDAGHLQGGRHNKYLLDYQQIRAQCKYCNGFLQGNGAIFYKNLVKELGVDVVDSILEENKQLKQYKVYQLLEMAEDFKTKTKALIDEYNIKLSEKGGII